MQSLLALPHVVLDVDPLTRIVYYRRTSLKITVEDFESMIGRPAEQALVHIDRSRHALLFDMREAPLASDEVAKLSYAFGIVMRTGFRKTAVVVLRSVGELQVVRMERERPGPLQKIFRDKEEAVAWLSSDTPADR